MSANTNPFDNIDIRTTVNRMYAIPFLFTFPTTTPQAQTLSIYAPTDCELYIVNSIFSSVYDNTGSYPDDIAVKPLITLQIQNKSTSDFFFDSPVDLYLMNKYSNLRSLPDIQFKSKAQINVTANLTNANSVAPTAPLTVQVILFGTKYHKRVN